MVVLPAPERPASGVPGVGWGLTICGWWVVVGMEDVGCWWECSADGMRVWGSGDN